MLFEWDEAKSDACLNRRGFGFDFAALIFGGPILEAIDARHDYGETRVQAIGEAGGITLFVVFTDRGEVRRIISARIASQRERKLWLSFVGH